MTFIFSVWNSISSLFISSTNTSERETQGNRFYGDCISNQQLQIQRKNVKGIVTFYNESNGNGRIDGHINFDSRTNILFKCEKGAIKVGTEVLVDLMRNTKLSPWTITNMEVLKLPDDSDSDWTEKNTCQLSKKEEQVLPQKQVGMITHVYNDDLILNNDIQFRQKDCGVNSFRPTKGDWVILQFDHIVRKNKVISMLPLRYIDFEGTVSFFNGKVGYIDREIYFTKYVLKNEYVKKGMQVYGTAIESVQGRNCNFRALTVFKQASSNIKSNLKMRVKSSDFCLNDVVHPIDIGLYVSETTVDFGEQTINEVKTREITITNKSQDDVLIKTVEFYNEVNDQFILVDDVTVVNLIKDESLKITVRCKPQFLGFDAQKLILTIDKDKLYKVVVDTTVYVVDPISSEFKMNNDVKDIQPIAYPSSDRVSGIYLPSAKPVKVRSTMTKMYPHKLKSYNIPEGVEKLVSYKEDISNFFPFINETLNPGNYFDKMNLLIHLEELNTKEEMKQFILNDIRMLSRHDTFRIEVPGLTEGRPSLIIGDKVIIQVSEPNNPKYSGVIEEILSNCIFVKFHPILHTTYTNEICTVHFEHSRLPYRRMHLGVDMACGNLGDSILFPSKIIKKSSQCVRLSRTGISELSAANFVKEDLSNLLRLKFYNNNLNTMQRIAVIRILHGYSRPLPYVLFGPPGTGKTVTLVEAILQVYKNVPSSRILVCAPSNSATDLLCLRLHETHVIETGEMVRMNAYRRSVLSEVSDKDPIPPKILPYCMSADNLVEVAMHRIIITTCVTSGALYQLGLKAGHISHVFVDEAGQASEPEIMISLGFIAPSMGQIVMAGDPKQLGPVIRSKQAKTLEESYLHRLILTTSLYKKQNEVCPGSNTLFNPLVVTRLFQNYRAHPALLKLSSELFYDDSLEPLVEKKRFIGWEHLPNPDFPMVFQGVRGCELRNARNPSTYNPSEAVMVARWIGRIMQSSTVDSNDDAFDYSKISVITPYRAQVNCIRKMISSCLDNVDLAKLKVGSVEEFQGQENDVVIISTVRSSLDSIKDELQQHESVSIMSTLKERLNFLSNERRFNVSITRACSLLIVIGDPHLLKYSTHWASLIQYARDNNAYCGAA